MKPAASPTMKTWFAGARARRTLSLYGWLYVFILPGVVLLFLFSYVPMLGVQIAFKDFVIWKGMWTSPWAGLKYFYFLGDSIFWQSFVNTVAITGLRFFFGFPAPILLALMLNEVRSDPYKRVIQSLSYLPHFISWIVVSYILYTFLQMDTGPLNMLMQSLGFDQVNFMGTPKYFRPIVIVSAIWKEIGWGTIIYLAALSAIDPQLYEAAMLDGAGRFRRIVSINIPGIAPTISILLILSLPGLLTAGYDQIYPLVNPTNLGVSNVLDVYLIRLGLTQAQYSVATAIGLVLAVVNISIVLGSNWFAKRIGQTGFW
jgi:putative aldouronate transport system permease protein